MKKIKIGIVVMVLTTVIGITAYAQDYQLGGFLAKRGSWATTKQGAFYFDEGSAQIGVKGLQSNWTSSPRIEYDVKRIVRLAPDVKLEHVDDVGNYSENYDVISGAGYYLANIRPTNGDGVRGNAFGNDPK